MQGFIFTEKYGNDDEGNNKRIDFVGLFLDFLLCWISSDGNGNNGGERNIRKGNR